jgi:hypothetical protein
LCECATFHEVTLLLNYERGFSPSELRLAHTTCAIYQAQWGLRPCRYKSGYKKQTYYPVFKLRLLGHMGVEVNDVNKGDNCHA